MKKVYLGKLGNTQYIVIAKKRKMGSKEKNKKMGDFSYSW